MQSIHAHDRDHVIRCAGDPALSETPSFTRFSGGAE